MEVNNQILNQIHQKYSISNWLVKNNIVQEAFSNLRVVNPNNVGISIAVVDFVYSTQIKKFKTALVTLGIMHKITAYQNGIGMYSTFSRRFTRVRPTPSFISAESSKSVPTEKHSPALFTAQQAL